MSGAAFDGCQHDPPHLHGETRTYRTHKCRCVDCREANRAAQSDLRRRKAYGRSTGFVPADETRAHLDRLVRSGLALARITEQTGIDERSLARLLKGRPDRSTSRVKESTRDRILAVAPARYVHEVSGRAFVPALGTIRRLNALHAVGWPTGAIAREAGLHATTLNGIRRQRLVTVHTATAIARAYDRVWDVPPPSATRADRASTTQALRRAAANGWPPPMAWDDHNLDRPNGRPSPSAIAA